MRADLTPLLVTALYLFAGLGAMAALGYLRTVRGTLAALGMAYLTGLVAVLLAGTWLLSAGIAMTAPAMGLLSAVVGGAGFAVALRRRRRADSPPQVVAAVEEPHRMGRPELVLTALSVAGLVAVGVLGFLSARRMGLTEWDAWSIWTRKARILLEHGTPSTAFFDNPSYRFMHPDYPLLVPLMEATWFRVAGFADVRGVHAQFWLLLVGFVWAAAWVVGRTTRPVVWLAVLGAVALAPGVRTQLLTMYADIPMALLIGLGALLVGRWLQDGDRRELALGVLMLAGGASTKNEGVPAAAAVLVAALLVALVSADGGLKARLRGARTAVVAAAALVVTLLPWRIWLAAKGIEGDMPVGKGLDPAYLADRSERVWPSVKGLAGPLSESGTWLLLVPMGIAAVVAGLLSAGLRRVAAFYGVAGLLTFLAYVWAYWISPNDLTYHITTSAYRVVDAVVLLAAAATLHLAALASRRIDRPAA